MSFENLIQNSLDYFPCRYGKSKLLFRGPKRRPVGDYAAFLGGAETYGRFVEMPFSTLVEHETGLKSINLGCVNVGIDAYSTDRTLIEICQGAKLTVIQAMGAQNMSNRYYAVHPRRNDRFLHASSQLKAIYGDVDFTDFNFTRHLMTSLSELSPEKFEIVEQELKQAWVGRMQGLIDRIGGKVVLLWLSDHAPGDPAKKSNLNDEPMFIDRAMITALSSVTTSVVEIVATRGEIVQGRDEMVFSDLEEPAADEMLGPVVHRRVAEAVSKVIKKIVL